jgi:hypothetical protein
MMGQQLNWQLCFYLLFAAALTNQARIIAGLARVCFFVSRQHYIVLIIDAPFSLHTDTGSHIDF